MELEHIILPESKKMTKVKRIRACQKDTRTNLKEFKWRSWDNLSKNINNAV
jgi:hypothetical protein